MVYHKPIHILAIEDSEVDIHRLSAALQGVEQFPFELSFERRLASGLVSLANATFDVVLLDLILPDSAGLETVERVHRVAPHTPIIVLTHVDDELNAVEAVRRGAQDYLFKVQLDGLLVSRAIRYAMERKRVERALNESIDARRELESEVLRISTREQQRISQDLHDSVGQQLTGLSYLARSLAKHMADTSPSQAADAQMIVEGLQSALTEVRNAIRGLAPVEFDSEGLMAAINQLVTTTAARCDTLCQFVCDEPVLIENNTTATHLFRIAQEALHNAVKHSQAERILVHLRYAGDHVVLQVSDDGKGLTMHSGGESGLGLHIMHYRARMIDATLDVSSNFKQGTCVTCSVKREVAYVDDDI